ncbi:MAG: hypothetical protein HCTETUND2_174 [Candidatus Hodgkinia cicadicola]|nr:MAG: hypothetical protein HCTETUND2_174 [Candidatus Hodgkinia cicadicola]
MSELQQSVFSACLKLGFLLRVKRESLSYAQSVRLE